MCRRATVRNCARTASLARSRASSEALAAGGRRLRGPAGGGGVPRGSTRGGGGGPATPRLPAGGGGGAAPHAAPRPRPSFVTSVHPVQQVSGAGREARV